jgi:hypothetical protein
MRVISQVAFFLYFIIFSSAILFGVSNEEEKKGVVTYVDAQVKRKAVDEEEWQSAPVNTEVVSGDKVRTYRQSRAELDIAKLDIIRLAPRTIIDILKLYEETKEKKIKTAIHLEEGELWAAVHEVEMETDFDISAPIAAAAITGTILRMHVDSSDTTTQLKVYKGEVRITNAPQKTNLQPQSIVPKEVPGPHEIQGPHEVTLDEWVYIVRAMQQITIAANGSVLSKGSFTAGDTDEKNSWVEWNQQRDKDRFQKKKWYEIWK